MFSAARLVCDEEASATKCSKITNEKDAVRISVPVNEYRLIGDGLLPGLSVRLRSAEYYVRTATMTALNIYRAQVDGGCGKGRREEWSPFTPGAESSWSSEVNVDGVPGRTTSAFAPKSAHSRRNRPAAADPAVASEASRRPLQHRDLAPCDRFSSVSAWRIFSVARSVGASVASMPERGDPCSERRDRAAQWFWLRLCVRTSRTLNL